MIQKISFGGNYKFGYSRQFGFNKSMATTAYVFQGTFHRLKKGDEVTISKDKDGSSTLIAPDYMDKEIEKFCKYSAISYEKLDK